MRTWRGQKIYWVLTFLGVMVVSSLISGRNCEALETPLTVNDPGDAVDANLGDEICETAPGNNICTLRAAIMEAHASNKKVILFALGMNPAVTIGPDSLPELSLDGLVIGDSTGLSQRIAINGHGVGGIGLHVVGPNITLTNLNINNFDVGIQVSGSGQLKLKNTYLGIDRLGTFAQPNRIGVLLNTADNVIGGDGVSDGNVISGNTQFGIFIDGNSAQNNLIQKNRIGMGVDGLTPISNGEDGILIRNAPNNLIGGDQAFFGNVISGNTRSGIDIEGIEAANNIIRHNIIGLGTDGSTPLGNLINGIEINDSPDNLIRDNTISDNHQFGIEISGSTATGNQILANRIGVERIDDNDRGNHEHGIHIHSASETVIGQVDDGNLISGNGGSGIFIESFSNDNQIVANLIGLNATADGAIGNDEHGITILDSQSNQIGGTISEAGNIIGGNGKNGLYLEGSDASINQIRGNKIGTNLAGNEKIANDGNGIEIIRGQNNQVGGPANGEGNLISGNGGHGVLLWGEVANANKIMGNKIGLNEAGTSALGNAQDGIRLTRIISHTVFPIENKGPSQTEIGGIQAGQGNVISGNLGTGVSLEGKNTSLNSVLGNLVGTDKTGQVAIGNGKAGIHITSGKPPAVSTPNPGAPNNNTIGAIDLSSVGGPCTGGCNLISGNGAEGIRIDGAGVSANKVMANFIGVDRTGTKALPNHSDGLAIVGAHKNFIGSYPISLNEPNPHRNLISGNDGFGVRIFGGLAKSNTIFGNTIGTDVTGTKALGNVGGILVEKSNGNQLGDAAPQTGNLIAGNAGPGIEIDESQNTLVQGNRIGLQSDGMTALGNQGHGIHIINASTANFIGGENSGQGNHIAFNDGDGVRVTGLRNIEVIGNSIHDNTGMGIDLDPVGVNLNDEGDVDEGVNESQNFPDLTSVLPLSLEIEVSGTINALPNREYRVHFYSNEVCEDDEHAQGKYFLGLDLVTTNEAGIGEFATRLPKVGGDMIMATATDDSRNTSEFSPCIKVGTTGPGQDFDLDGVLNIHDNCINDPNPNQEDADGDGEGDPCDLCIGVNDHLDLDKNQVPDCLELLFSGAGSSCALSRVYLGAVNGVWFWGGLLILGILVYRLYLEATCKPRK